MSSRLKSRSLRSKLIFIAIFTTGLTLLVCNLSFIAYEYYLSRQDVDKKLTILSDVITSQAGAALLFNDFAMLQTNLDALQADANIVRGCIYNSQLQQVVGYHLATTPACPKLWHELTPSTRFNFFRHFPIQIQGTNYGTLYLETSHKDLIDRSQQLLSFSVLIFLVAISLAWLLANSMQGVILRPIQNLSITLRNIMRKKDYSFRAHPNNNNAELGVLIDLFNSLLTTIESDNASLKESEDRFRRLTALAPVGIFQLDAKQNILYINQRWRDIHHLNIAHPQLADWFQCIHPSELKQLQPHWQTLLNTQNSITTEFRLKEHQGRTTWVQLLAGALHDHQGNLLGYLGTISDISEMKSAQLQMENLAFYDSLTGLANRRLFRDRLEKAITLAQRSQSSVALLFLDMDQFKRVNDTLGHDAGDELLKTVASRLRECIRDSDTVSRIGGDEFTILLTEIHSPSDVVPVAEKILQRLAQPIRVAENEVSTSVSIGITLTPEDSLDANTLMKNADMAMYRAKELGRNTYQFFSEEMNRAVLEHIELENELLEALSNNQFVLAFQPKVSLFNFSITGLEVLLRWQHPEKGLIAPDRFIPIAEESGQILHIGQWVLQQACLQMSSLRQQYPLLADAKIAVNLSARQFVDPQLLERIQACLHEANLPSECLELEITESTLMDDVEDAIVTMNRIKQLGVSIAIDDFGTGYSSLSYLKRFPIDVLKVDRSFVMDIPQGKNDMAITAAVIAMAHKLNLNVVAEGIEERAQLDFLHANFCDEGQGYFFSRPLYWAQLHEFLQHYQPSKVI